MLFRSEWANLALWHALQEHYGIQVLGTSDPIHIGDTIDVRWPDDDDGVVVAPTV